MGRRDADKAVFPAIRSRFLRDRYVPNFIDYGRGIGG
jgi:hypothetical protein